MFLKFRYGVRLAQPQLRQAVRHIMDRHTIENYTPHVSLCVRLLEQHESVMKEKYGTEYFEETQDRHEVIAIAESWKAGLATVADIEESQEILSTSSDDEMVITTENDAANIQAMADDAEPDLNVEVIHAGSAPTIGVEAQPRESSPHESISTVISVARSAAS